jgi:hypothetical protein
MDKQVVKTQTKTSNTKIQDTVNNPDFKKLPPDDQKDVASEMKFLAQTWLDDYEKKVFDGKTINDLLNKERYE